MTTSQSDPRPLVGFCIGISISEGADLVPKFGLSESDITTTTVELCRRFVGLGAQVALGHQWRPKGIMEEVAQFARAYQWEAPSKDSSIIHNFLAWPDRAALTELDRKELKPMVQFYDDNEPSKTRAAALTAMRQRMTAACQARLCLAGKTIQPGDKKDGAKPDQKFVSGVLEEASYMIQQKRPVYLSGMMGGATLLLIEKLRGRNVEPKDFGGDPERTQKLLEPFRSENWKFIAEISGLTMAEQDELFDSQNLDTIVELTARGLRESKFASKAH